MSTQQNNGIQAMFIARPPPCTAVGHIDPLVAHVSKVKKDTLCFFAKSLESVDRWRHQWIPMGMPWRPLKPRVKERRFCRPMRGSTVMTNAGRIKTLIGILNCDMLISLDNSVEN
jgi:hypothetical protein